jgi:hypothetical protein
MPGQNSHPYGYELAYRLACEQLATSDIEQLCLKSGTKCKVIDSQKVIIVEYLNQSYQVQVPDGKISLLGSGGEVPIRDRILILHYLTQARGTPTSNKAITYKELPEGVNYFPTFFKRAIKPVVDHFGNEPQQLLNIAATLGGHKADYGDVAVTINAFSRVPITFVLWRGDDEFPPDGNIIFDANISDYLSTEDINVLCEIIAWRMVKLLRARKSSPSGA